MSRMRRVLLAIVALVALAAVPTYAEVGNVFVGPARYVTGSMSKSGVTVSFVGEIFDGVEAGIIDGQPHAGPLIEAIWGVVTVRNGTLSKSSAGWWLYAVSVEPVLGAARMSGDNGGVSIDVTLTATGIPTPAPFTPDPGAIDPPSFVYAEAGLNVTRTASVAGRGSATGVGGITGGTGSGKIGAASGAYIFYA